MPVKPKAANIGATAVPATRRSRREDYTDSTRQALLDAARTLFVSTGYHQTSTEAVVTAARLTKGALYHHFTDKAALLEALVIQLQQQAAERMRARAGKEKTLWECLRAACESYLDICTEHDYQQLVIRDAPAALGAERAGAIGEQYVIGPMVRVMERLKADGELDVGDARLAGRMVARMLCEAAELLAQEPQPARMRKEALANLSRVLDAFRPRSAGAGRAA
ncbi:MAG: helix-turn-helix domain-containing protein [Pseudomonadota bacterium]